MQIGNSIIESIQIIAKYEVENAKFDKTIEAEIITCIDENIGYYRCNYKGAIIYAYSTNLDIIYQKGNLVYILIPENDITKNKIILGFAGASNQSDFLPPSSKSLRVSVEQEQQNLAFSYKGSNNLDQVNIS